MDYKCRNCTKRYPACHDTCPDYIEERQANIDLKKHKKLINLADNFAAEQSKERKAQWIKKYK